VSSVIQYPGTPQSVPDLRLEAGAYRIRYARSPDELDAVLRLRYQVFNLELGEGLDESHQTGRDEDGLDGRMHHLMIEDRSGEVVGTYRMQTAEMAARHGGFYSADEFELESLPDGLLDGAVEIGRACVAKEHRNGRVLHLLWRGLAAYLTWNRKHYLFGCCSLTSQDPALGLSVHRHLQTVGAVHDRLCLDPRPGYRCSPVDPTRPLPPPHIPALFRSYLALGAKVCGPPALDRRFKTIDWLVLLDTATIDPAIHQSFFR